MPYNKSAYNTIWNVCDIGMMLYHITVKIFNLTLLTECKTAFFKIACQYVVLFFTISISHYQFFAFMYSLYCMQDTKKENCYMINYY